MKQEHSHTGNTVTHRLPRTCVSSELKLSNVRGRTASCRPRTSSRGRPGPSPHAGLRTQERSSGLLRRPPSGPHCPEHTATAMLAPVLGRPTSRHTLKGVQRTRGAMEPISGAPPRQGLFPSEAVGHCWAPGQVAQKEGRSRCPGV